MIAHFLDVARIVLERESVVPLAANVRREDLALIAQSISKTTALCHHKTGNICWAPKQAQTTSNCTTRASLSITAPWIAEAMTVGFTISRKINRVALLPCQPGAFKNQTGILKNCTFCVDLRNITFEESKGIIRGCPTLNLNCFERDVYTQPMSCVVMLTDPKLKSICPTTTGSGAPQVGPTPSLPSGAPVATDESPIKGYLFWGSIIAFIAVVVVAAGIYFAWMHYQDRKNLDSNKIDTQELGDSMSESDSGGKIINNDVDVSLSESD